MNLDTNTPAAQTIIELDGDTKTIVPMRRSDTGGLVLDDALFDFHQSNVTAAIEYRARILNALLSAIQTRLR